MLKQEHNLQTASPRAAQVQVTPEELAAAIAVLQILTILQPDPPSKEWSVYPATANDADLSSYQSDVVSPLGNIYAIDDPGINTNDSTWATNEVRRLRFNGLEFAEILAQGKPTRCSLIAGFYIRLSAKNNGNGDFKPSNDQANDNKAGTGTTSVIAGP